MSRIIEFRPTAERFLRKLKNTELLNRIGSTIELLKKDPFPSSSKKLKGIGDFYRLRIGDYRIVYQIHQTHILILDIDHRKDIYRH